MIDKKLLGEKIKSIRLNMGMTLQEFGAIFQATKSNVSKWEHGQSLPNKERLRLIAKLGNTTVDDLINEYESKNNTAFKEIKTMNRDIMQFKIDMLEEELQKLKEEIKRR